MKKRASCCSCEDIFVAACIASGLLCLAGSVAEFATHIHQPLIRILTVDATVAVGGVLCLLETIPCWRKVVSSGFLGGYSAILIGFGMGFGLILIWNESSEKYVSNDYSSTTTIHGEVDQWYRTDKIAVPLHLAAALLLGLIACLNEVLWCAGRSSRVSCFTVCSHLLLGLSAGTTIAYCTAMALFIFWPSVEGHSWLFGNLIEAPPRGGNPSTLMGSLMVSGAIVNWLALFRRPMCGNLSFLCTLAAVAVLLGHVVALLSGIVEFDYPQNWKIYPQLSVWVMFSISSCLLLVTVLLHSSASMSSGNRPHLDPVEKFTLDITSAERRQRLSDTNSTVASSVLSFPLPPPQPYLFPAALGLPSVHPQTLYAPHYGIAQQQEQQRPALEHQTAFQRYSLDQRRKHSV